MRFIAVFILCLAYSVSGFTQEIDKGTVYIYKTPHGRTLWRATFPVYVDEVLAAKLDGGRYFTTKLSPGKHTFRSKDKRQGGVEVEIKAGETYYLRLETEEGATVGKPRILYVPAEEGSYDIKQMKLIKAGDVKNKAIVESSDKDK